MFGDAGLFDTKKESKEQRSRIKKDKVGLMGAGPFQQWGRQAHALRALAGDNKSLCSLKPSGQVS
jgi:hypothetical protein